MPPIPLNIDAPLTPQKPQGATPQTTNASPPNPATAPASVPATTTATSTSSYTPAQPGAAAYPAPTPFTPSQPTRTTAATAQYDGPPPPQPGALPMPPSTGMTPSTSTLPPPPKPGEAAAQRRASVTTAAPGLPGQMNIPPPHQNAGSTYSTSAAYPSTPARTVNLGLINPTPPGPPGSGSAYQQNTYAQELSPGQRASLEAQERSEVGVGGGLLGAARRASSEGAGEEGVLGTVKGWMGTVGKGLESAEEEVWRRINGYGK